MPIGQRSMHVPARQSDEPPVGAGHAFPQRPQCLGSLVVETQAPLQRVWFSAHCASLVTEASGSSRSLASPDSTNASIAATSSRIVVESVPASSREEETSSESASTFAAQRSDRAHGVKSTFGRQHTQKTAKTTSEAGDTQGRMPYIFVHRELGAQSSMGHVSTRRRGGEGDQRLYWHWPVVVLQVVSAGHAAFEVQPQRAGDVVV